jgi:formylglycine-generating enzyme required for sulfatase activity
MAFESCMVFLLLVAMVPLAPPAAAAEPAPPKAGTVFQDCPLCPEMVVIPPGRFVMGSSAADIEKYRNLSSAGDEGPQHQVTIVRPFAVSRFEITRGQYAAFVRDTGYRAGTRCTVWNGTRLLPTEGKSWDNNDLSAHDADPVLCITWADTMAYVDWLGRTTGRYYRLLSEAEWEYMARAGSTSLYFYGDSPDALCQYGNVNDLSSREGGGGTTWVYATCRDGYGVSTAPVGSFKPNAFGVYDTIGNVWERVEDCYHESYDDAPTDGSAWTTQGLRNQNGVTVDCNYRVTRGSGWRNAPTHFRPGNRYGGYPLYFQGDYVGMRVARSL